MRILTVALAAVLCRSDSAAIQLTAAAQAWGSDPGDFTFRDAIWAAADDLGVDTVCHSMPDNAVIATDVRSDDLTAGNLMEEELTALNAVGDEFGCGDDTWLEQLATEDDTRPCQSAYEMANG